VQKLRKKTTSSKRALCKRRVGKLTWEGKRAGGEGKKNQLDQGKGETLYWSRPIKGKRDPRKGAGKRRQELNGSSG